MVRTMPRTEHLTGNVTLSLTPPNSGGRAMTRARTFSRMGSIGAGFMVWFTLLSYTEPVASASLWPVCRSGLAPSWQSVTCIPFSTLRQLSAEASLN
jgi:hypothetical protein